MEVSMKESKIVQLDDHILERAKQITPVSIEHGILKQNRSGGITMENKYVTEKDLRHSEEKTELKLQQVDTKIETMTTILNNKIDLSTQNIIANMDIMKVELSSKTDQTKNELEKLLLEQKVAATKEAAANRRWLIGIAVTIGIFIVKEFLLK